MTLIIGKGSIEEKIKKETAIRKQVRTHMEGLQGDIYGRNKDRAQRGDYGLCRESDKTLSDYKRFKDPKDRKKISEEYYGRQTAERDKVRQHR